VVKDLPDPEATAACYRLSLRVPRAALSLIELALEGLGGALVVGGPEEGAPEKDGRVSLDLFLDARPDDVELQARMAAAAVAAGIEPPGYSVEPLAEIDWVAESQRGLPAVRAGRFFLHGSHVEGPAPAGAIPLLVEANAAFGTGHHESTFGCLLALSRLAKQRRFHRILDMGAGSGVLAMAAAKLWRVPVLAVEMDRPSVQVAGANARINGLGAAITFLEAAGYRHSLVSRRGPYELIVANILAEPLIAMAGDLRRHLAPGGYAVLAGLMAAQKKGVVARHRAVGLRLVETLAFGDWVTLVLRRRGVPRREAAGPSVG
jgi:ribosomal protein L11 methyltransferase